MPADAAVALRGPGYDEFGTAASAFAGALEIGNLIKLAALMADENIQRVASVVGDEIAGEKIDIRAAFGAVDDFHPQGVFDWHVGVAVLWTGCAVKLSDLIRERCKHSVDGRAVSGKLEMFDLLAHNPGGHGIDVEAEHVATDAVGFKQRGAAAHEGVTHTLARKIVGAENNVAQRLSPEFCQGEAPKESAGTPGEPFVHGDDRAVILLDLLFAQCHGGDEGNIEACFDRHGFRGG
jgi:hypothetical protein